MRKFALVAAAVLVGTAGAAENDEGLTQEKSYNHWHFRIGPVMSPRVRVKISGAPNFALPMMPTAAKPGPNSQTSGTGGTAPADPSAGYVPRQYADGHVNPDEGTFDPDAVGGMGLTWDWSAANVPAQYSNGRMEFRTEMTRWEESVSSSSSSSFSSYSSGSSSESDRDSLIGVEAMGGWTFWDNQTFDAAIDAGFRFYGSGYLDAESQYGYRYETKTTTTTTRNEYRYVDSYDASGWTDIPQGGHAWNPGYADRVIGAMPTRREELMGSSSSTETSSSSESYTYSSDSRLVYRIWDLRLGPTFGWHVTDWFALRGGVYGLLGLVDATLKTDGGVAGGTSASTCGAVFGMAFGVSGQVNLTDNLFVMGGVEYDWWTDSVDLNAGGANAEIKLSDMSISIGFGVEF